MQKTTTDSTQLHHIFMLVVGASGAGKTYLLGTLPEDETIILSAESGLLPLRHKNIEVWNINTKQDLLDAFKELREGVKTQKGNAIKNIAVDSLTEIGEILFRETKPHFSKAQNFQLYEEYGAQLVNFIKSMRDMNQYNFIMTALDKDMGDGVVGIDLIQKSLSKKLPAYFDLVTQLVDYKGETETRKVLLTNHALSPFCKDRSGDLDDFETPNLNTIFNKIFNTKQTKGSKK